MKMRFFAKKSLIKRIALTLAIIMTVPMIFVGCDSSDGEWEDVRSINVKYSSPRVSKSGSGNGDGYCDSFYLDIDGRSADNGDENGHYIYKNASVTLTITIDGEDYTHKIRISEDGSVDPYSSYIKLKKDAPVSKVKSGYVRVSKVEGKMKQVPHTYELYGTPSEPDCAKGSRQSYKCKECGGYKEVDLSAPLGHQIGDDGICSICNRDFSPETDNGNSGISYIAAKYDVNLNLDISPDGIGTRTGTLEIEVFNDRDVISGWGAESTKDHIIKINGVPQWSGNKLIVSYTVMGYGEADILVELFSNELNDEYRAEIHVNVFDD